VNFPWTGIALDNGSSGNLVEGNILKSCNFACIKDKASHGGNTIDWNDFLTSANYGLWNYFPSDDDVFSTLNVGVPVEVCNATDVVEITLADVPHWELVNGKSYCAVP
jgi:hypothetical protein